MVEVERVSREADHFNPTGIQALTILDSLTFYRQVSRACLRDLRSAMLCLLLPKRCCCCCKLTRCTLVQANQVLKCEADTKKPIDSDKLCAGAREILPSPTLGFCLASPSDPPLPAVWLC